MAKSTTRFVCAECGYTSVKWLGKCPGCDNWNTLIEEEMPTEIKGGALKSAKAAKIYTFADIPSEQEKRFSSDIREFDRVLGGGVVPGSVVLSGGEPGIGKSTLFLQVAKKLSSYGKVLYVSGEESPSQVKMRAKRLNIDDGVFLMAETEVNSIVLGAAEEKPKFLIVDSIQTLYDSNLSSAPGSVAQVRGCAAKLTTLAKKSGIATFIIGHVTKEGALAGPRVLEHMVDTVLYFEGERTSNLRILRAVKNRFGSTDEIGVFEMRDTGMEEVLNPTMLLPDNKAKLDGVCVFAATQGTRPMLLEIQALCSHTQINIPRRLCSGADVNRLYMICAVLEKKIGLKLYTQDIFVNVAGGIKIKEHAADLALSMAIVSSLRSASIPPDTAFIGEIGLAGEIRHVNMLSRRIAECERMGIKRIFVPTQSLEKQKHLGVEVVGVKTLFEVFDRVF